MLPLQEVRTHDKQEKNFFFYLPFIGAGLNSLEGKASLLEERYLKHQVLRQDPTKSHVLSRSHGFSHLCHNLCSAQDETSAALADVKLWTKYRLHVHIADHSKEDSAILDMVDSMLQCSERGSFQLSSSIRNSCLGCLQQE